MSMSACRDERPAGLQGPPQGVRSAPPACLRWRSQCPPEGRVPLQGVRSPRRGNGVFPARALSGQQREVDHVTRSYDAEMAAVERGDLGEAVAFRGCDDGGVDGPERQVVVRRYEFGDPEWVGGVDGLDGEVSAGEVAEEAHLGLPVQTSCDQVGDLGDDERRDDQWSRVRFEKLQAGTVVRVVGVYVGVERAGVDDQCDGAISEPMISSMRSEISCVPLRAAAAPVSRRLRPLPRCASSAVRVICAMVTPWRLASCRSRASRSSGSFTVVRCMYASISRLAGFLRVHSSQAAASGARNAGVQPGVSAREACIDSGSSSLFPALDRLQSGEEQADRGRTERGVQACTRAREDKDMRSSSPPWNYEAGRWWRWLMAAPTSSSTRSEALSALPSPIAKKERRPLLPGSLRSPSIVGVGSASSPSSARSACSSLSSTVTARPAAYARAGGKYLPVISLKMGIGCSSRPKRLCLRLTGMARWMCMSGAAQEGHEVPRLHPFMGCMGVPRLPAVRPLGVLSCLRPFMGCGGSPLGGKAYERQAHKRYATKAPKTSKGKK